MKVQLSEKELDELFSNESIMEELFMRLLPCRQAEQTFLDRLLQRALEEIREQNKQGNAKADAEERSPDPVGSASSADTGPIYVVVASYTSVKAQQAGSAPQEG